jgi:hypothetical protein
MKKWRDMKGEFKKNIEIQKLKLKSSISQIKASVGRLCSRLDPTEDSR